MSGLLEQVPDPVAAGALTAVFERAFGAPVDGVWSAPGRVNLIGEHVDYNGGLCLPLALPLRTYVAARRRDDDVVRLLSRQEPRPWEGRLGEIRPGRVAGWAAYAAGVLWALREAGLDVWGCDLAVDGHVPLGAGLSSSAALECAVALAVSTLAGTEDDERSRRMLAAACVRAENDVAGAPTGGMDQMAALLATSGHALLLDCRDGTASQVPLGLAESGLALLVVDTRAPHRLVDGQYAARRRACEQAAAALAVPDLRAAADAPDGPERVERLADATLRKRARHVVREIGRVVQAVECLRKGDVPAVGPLLDDSHLSLRDDYEVSSPELDLAVEATRSAGALGARMTGGGFGGSAVALVWADGVDEVADAVSAAFAAAGFRSPAFLAVEPSGGARRDL